MADEFIYNSMELFDEFINFPIDETDPVIPNPFIYNEEPSIGDEIFGLLPDGIGAVIPDPPTYNEGPSIDDTKIEEGGDAKETGRKQAEESAESALKGQSYHNPNTLIDFKANFVYLQIYHNKEIIRGNRVITKLINLSLWICPWVLETTDPIL